ncbi:hypothetical protein F5Y18DRAFT_388789 [Xylariaceae sp. FL1019]|nr:hypothetical protein F5Y18DRAFT_388789 [Xylariaceae sp. FL1019]
MHLRSFSSALLAAMSTAPNEPVLVWDGSKYPTSCSIEYGATSVRGPLPLYTHTSTVIAGTQTVVADVTQTATQTAWTTLPAGDSTKWVDQYKTITKSIAGGNASTIYLTKTETSTATAPLTQTQTQTITTTIPTHTLTIPTPCGFTAIQSNSNADSTAAVATATDAVRPLIPVLSRDFIKAHSMRIAWLPNATTVGSASGSWKEGPNMKHLSDHGQYPTAIKCHVTQTLRNIEVITPIASTMTTVTVHDGKSGTHTVTQTRTGETTVTMTGGASNAPVVKESTTTTLVHTKTTTVAQATQTVGLDHHIHNACLDYFNYVNRTSEGHGITAVTGSGTSEAHFIPDIKDAKTCCEACFDESIQCRGSAFHEDVGCYLFLGYECRTGHAFGDMYLSTDELDVGYTVANGPCGVIGHSPDIK